MITPQEADQYVFSKSSFGGYNMAQVDAFLDELVADYTTLFKENTSLKNKIKVLVDKVEEYRSTEDAMRKALLTAQRLADNMVKEAEEAKRKALEAAEAEVKSTVESLQREVVTEQLRLAAAKKETLAYVRQLKTLYAQQEEFFSRLADMTPDELQKAESPSGDPVAAVAQEIAKSVEEFTTPEEPDEPAAEAPAPEEPAAEAKPSKAKSSKEKVSVEDTHSDPSLDKLDLSDTLIFDNLQFGKDYELK